MSFTRFHLVVPTRWTAHADLPAFITDVRPADGISVASQASRCAELTGLDGVIVPFDPDGLDPLVVAASLLRETTTLKVTASFHPAIATPVYAANLSASLQRFTGSRLSWFVHAGLDPAVARAEGDFLTGPDRYLRAEEFLTIAKQIWHEKGVAFSGRFYQVRGGGLPVSPRFPARFPRVYLSGSSPEALALSARHADMHVVPAGADVSVVPFGVGRAVWLPAQDLGLAKEYVQQGVTEFWVTSADPVADAFRIEEAAAGVR